MAVQLMPVDPDTGIPDLVRRLADDSKRLVANEVRLAKLELRENLQHAGHGAVLLGVAFAMSIVAVVMLTLLIATLIGRLAAGHMWIGALVVGLLEIAVGAWFIKRGLSSAKVSGHHAKEAVTRS